MNAELIALINEYHLSEKTVSILFGVSTSAVQSWVAKPDAKYYRSMDRSYNKAMYRSKLRLMNRSFAKIRGM